MITLVLGGTRSGKSLVAERLVARCGGIVTVVAPAPMPATDEELAARVAAHRARRPPEWVTVECGAELVPALESVDGPALIDSLGSWLANTPDLSVELSALVFAMTTRRAPTVVVSEEVGLAVHPTTAAGRRFVDVLGDVNQAVSAIADETFLVVASRVLALTPLSEQLAPR